MPATPTQQSKIIQVLNSKNCKFFCYNRVDFLIVLSILKMCQQPAILFPECNYLRTNLNIDFTTTYIEGLQYYVTYFSVAYNLRLLHTFAGVFPCFPGKNSFAPHFNGKHGKLYTTGNTNKCRFWKNMNCRVF